MKEVETSNRYTIEVAGRYGQIDANGRIAVEPRFDFLGEYREGLTSFRNGERFGFIDSEGDTKIAPMFHSARKSGPHFSDGVALVGQPGALHYVDKSGNKTSGSFA